MFITVPFQKSPDRRRGSVSLLDVILDWLSGPGVDEFYIYRAGVPTGPFAQIDSTTAQSYTDAGIIATETKLFYRVTFSAGGLSSFRLPEAAPARE